MDRHVAMLLATTWEGACAFAQEAISSPLAQYLGIDKTAWRE